MCPGSTRRGHGSSQTPPQPNHTPPLLSFIQLLLSCSLYNKIITTRTVFAVSSLSHSSELSNLERGHVCSQVRQKCGSLGTRWGLASAVRAVLMGTLSFSLWGPCSLWVVSVRTDLSCRTMSECAPVNVCVQRSELWGTEHEEGGPSQSRWCSWEG